MQRNLQIVSALTFLSCLIHSSFVESFSRTSNACARRTSSENGESRSAPPLYQSRASEHVPSKDTLSIPVLPPIPNKPPLMIGSDIILDPPTPMQWKAIEEAVMQHDEQCRDDSIANIDAAPIVAMMGQEGREPMARSRIYTKYATIAAVVGMSKADKHNLIDLTDSASFMESLQKLGKDTIPSERRIRLVGIGRANLRDFVYRVPTIAQLDHEDEDGYLQVNDYVDDTSEHNLISNEPLVESSNIIMARFQLLRDNDSFSPDFQGVARPAYASPVHMMNSMSSLANKIGRLHQERRRLVRGLQAAKARVQLAGLSRDIEDFDGIGAVFAMKENNTGNRAELWESSESQVIVDAFLSEFPIPDYTMKELEAGIAQSDNYGMGFSSSSVADIPELTSAWMTKLDPFYTSHTRSTETFYYEVLSFVAMLSMEKVLTKEDLGWSLRCTNTVERLSQAYDWMLIHRERLLERTQIANKELMDCGEECTDLW